YVASGGFLPWTLTDLPLWWARASGSRVDADAEPAPPEPPRSRWHGERMARGASRPEDGGRRQAALSRARGRPRSARALPSRGDGDRPAEEPARGAHPRHRVGRGHSVLRDGATRGR